MNQPAFRLSLNGHYKLNTEAEAEIEKMKVSNTKLLKKMKWASYAMNTMPFIIFLSCYPIAALLSFIVQAHIESVFYMVAPLLLGVLYLSMKKLVSYQDDCKQLIEDNINNTVRETEDIIFRSPEPINESPVDDKDTSAEKNSVDLDKELSNLDSEQEESKKQLED